MSGNSRQRKKTTKKAHSKLSWILFLLITASSASAQSFSVSATPQTVTIHPGDQNVPVNVNVSSGTYTGPIIVTLAGLPSGISFSPLTLASGGSGTLLLDVAMNADQEAFPTDTIVANTFANTVTVVAAAGATQATSTFTLIVSLTNPAFAPSPSQINLPIVTINTNGTPIVDKTTDVPGTITITSANGQTSYLPNSSDTDNTATFHVHGNSTASMPKFPYELKLNTSLDLLTTMGLTCPYVTSSGKAACDKSKTYILLANYDDKTLLRDWAASALANAIPLASPYLTSPAGSPSPSGTSTLMPWAPHSLFVELYLNGVYEGNYQLIEKVNVDSHRVNITELSDTDTTDVTGGYLMEIDQRQDEDYVFVTPQGVYIGLIDPDFTPEVPQQTSYITDYVDAAENALYSSSFTDPTQGWRAYFDEASAVNFYIVNEVMGNVDGGDFFSSDYLYKDLDNPLLYMGPIWDFDISSGNVNYAAIVNPTVPWIQANGVWYEQWFKDSGFKIDVITQWNALKSNGVFAAWLSSIQQEAASLEQSQANNFGRWPMQGIEVWPNPEAVGSYDGEVAYLTNWIQLRIAYLDSLFNGKAQTFTALTVPTTTLRAGSPVTLTAQVTGGSAPTGTVSFLANGVLVGTGTLDGNGSCGLTTTALPAGTVNLEAVYNGDSTNGLSASSTQALTLLGPLIATATSLASSASTVREGTNVSLTASVIGNSGTAPPTGILTFYINGNPLGTATLTRSGTATFDTHNLPVGNDSVQAWYGGDGNYQGSGSDALSITVTVPPPNFTLSVSPSSVSVQAGQPASVALTITPRNDFTATVNFTCSGLPSGDTCIFVPSSITPGNTPVSVNCTIYAPDNIASIVFPSWIELGSGIAIALIFWPAGKPRAWIVFALCAWGCALAGCGNTAQIQTYPVAITASGGNISHVAAIQFRVKMGSSSK